VTATSSKPSWAPALTCNTVPYAAQAPARGMRISARRVGLGAAAGVALGLGLGLGVLVGVGFGVLVGVGLGVGFGVVAGLEGMPDDLAEATSARAVLARDRRAALLLMLVFGAVFGAGAGAAAGAGLGFWLSTYQAAWPSYLLTMGWLVFRHRLPRSLMGFLADAHQRGVLRQVGAVYQFRHIELQHRLANRAVNEVEHRHTRLPRC
jgi:hypothetical protein